MRLNSLLNKSGLTTEQRYEVIKQCIPVALVAWEVRTKNDNENEDGGVLSEIIYANCSNLAIESASISDVFVDLEKTDLVAHRREDIDSEIEPQFLNGHIEDREDVLRKAGFIYCDDNYCVCCDAHFSSEETNKHYKEFCNTCNDCLDCCDCKYDLGGMAS